MLADLARRQAIAHVLHAIPPFQLQATSSTLTTERHIGNSHARTACSYSSRPRHILISLNSKINKRLNRLSHWSARLNLIILRFCLWVWFTCEPRPVLPWIEWDCHRAHYIIHPCPSGAPTILGWILSRHERRFALYCGKSSPNTYHVHRVSLSWRGF